MSASDASGAAPTRVYTADHGVIGQEQTWVDAPVIEVDARGIIVSVASGAEALQRARTRDVIVHDLGRAALLPGLVNGHSHAFQRLIRGATQARGAHDPSDFWSWRRAMYEAALALTPEDVFDSARACFAEMLDAGITCVGEFHYLHHQRDGAPYDDACELSTRIIAAAREVGIRLVLLEVYYARAGAGQPALAEQRRFVDASVDAYLARVDSLRARVDRDLVDIGLAPHSVRAVDEPALRRVAAHARAHGLALHAHVSEQPRENEECRAEHGCSPTQLLARAGCLDAGRARAFTAVHAIYLDAHDHALLANQCVCACPTTEADLGDGIVPARALLERGATLALGSDSNSVIDLIQEARLLEMHERLRARARLQLEGPEGHVGKTLLSIATRGGALALGRPELGRLAPQSPFDAISVDLTHRSLEHVEPRHVLAALMLAGTAAPVQRVYVAGRRRR